MFKKKHFFILLLFLIIAIGAISQVSASDSDANDEIVSSDSSIEEVSANENIENDIVSADLNNDDIVSANINNDEIISSDSDSEAPAADQNSTDGGSVEPEPVKKVTISAAKLTAIYKSTKKFKVKVLDSNSKVVKGLDLKIKVYTGSKYKTFKVKTDSKGMATIKVSSFKLGKHKVVIETNNALYSGTNSSLIKINPRPVTFNAESGNDKEYSGVVAHVKDKTLKKYTNGIPIKILVYTGKKYKTYKTSTTSIKGDKKKKGAVIYLTNAFSVGKHKVKIIAYGKYKGTKTLKIKIRKSAKKNIPFYIISKKGKLQTYVKYYNQWIKTQ